MNTRGFALPTVLLILTLTSMATLLAWRNLWLTDQLLNIEADQLRTLHKAEAAVPIAMQAAMQAAIQIASAATPASAPTLAHRVVADSPSYWQTQMSNATPISANETPYGADTCWYWVDTFPQATAVPIYRITVLATGVQPNSTVVLQTLWSSGQSKSWRVLHE